VVLVVRRELADDLVELGHQVGRVGREPRLDHGGDAGLAGALGEFARRVEGVVEVEEDRA